MSRSVTPKARNALAAAWVWCAVTGGASALAASVMLGAMHFGANAAAFAGGAAALFAMTLLPAALTRRFVSRATVPMATSLVLAMSAMAAAAVRARAGFLPIGIPVALTLAGLAMFAAAWPSLLTRCTESMRPRRQIHRIAFQCAQRDFTTALRGSADLLIPALLAGLSSGVLARFQFFAVCGTGPFSLVQLAISLGAVVSLGLLAERIDHRYALLALFALRGALLAALTLDALAPWAVFAAPAFTVLDALTLPTLLRIGRAAQAGCPGFAHHAGMLAGAALATTSWGFGPGFHALFFAGATLNLVCACTLAARCHKRLLHVHTPHSTLQYLSTQYSSTQYSSSYAAHALASGGGIDIR
ncbi:MULTISPECIES: hypothetical protein [Paraburkholderia]|uniref:hypothetical protein n=1 Tax=Paraburkholderia TaxID=1822464 RepID=UPI00101A0570|nr:MULTISPECIES: hypothetical protein [Paraburkholderia]